MKCLLAALFFTTIGAPGALAQTTSDATIQALLAEVRQLRLALEKSAVMAPKIQLTLQRMQLQQDSVSRASRDLEDVRNQLSKSASEEARIVAEIRNVEARAGQEQDATRRKVLEDQLRVMMLWKPDQQKDSQLRAREIEMAGRLQTEQATLNELNERLNTLESMLEAPQSK